MGYAEKYNTSLEKLKTIKSLKNLIPRKKENQKQLIEKINAKLIQIPNLPNIEVPQGNSENDNEIILQKANCQISIKIKFLIGILQKNIT